MNRFKKGDVFYALKGDATDKPYRCHVCGIIDHKMVVYKWYGKHRQWWHYEIESFKCIQIDITIRRRVKTDDLSKLLELIEGRGKLNCLGAGITSYFGRDANNDRIHQACLQLEAEGKIRRHKWGDDWTLWMPSTLHVQGSAPSLR